MKLTALAFLAAFAGIISTTFAAPAPAAIAEIEARRAIPFKIIVSSPHRQTLVPEYSLCNGKLTSTAADAAKYYFSDTSPLGLLYCSDNTTSGQIGFTRTKYNFAVYAGTKGYYSRFSLADDKKLCFSNKGLGNAKWVLRGAIGGETIQADFGGFTTQDFIPAHLTAQF